MRTSVVENVPGSAEFHERLLHERTAKTRILDGCVELSVREGACSALPELDVAFRIERTAFKEPRDLCRSCQRVLSSLENDRLHAGQREMIGREETAGAAADHDRPVGRKFLSMFGKTVDLRMD